MKTNLLKSFLATVMLGSMAFNAAADDAPDYKPLLTGGKSWLMSECVSHAGAGMGIYFMVEVKGDTVIDDVACKHLERYYIGREAERSSLFAYEKDRKVYAFNPMVYAEEPDWMLLMDFSMTTGDSKSVTFDGKDEGCKRIVKEDKSVTAQGVDYRMLSVYQTQSGTDEPINSGYWVEGIGANTTAVTEWNDHSFSPSLPNVFHNLMVSCYQDGNKIFDYSDFDGHAYTHHGPDPILNEGKSWLIGAVRNADFPESRYMYSVGNDTIIEGKPCKVINFYNVDKPEEKDWLIASEINGRVFKVYDEYHSIGDETPGTFCPVLDIAVPTYYNFDEGRKLHTYDFRTGLPSDPEGSGEMPYVFGVRRDVDENHNVTRTYREVVVWPDTPERRSCWVEGIGASYMDYCGLTSFPYEATIGCIDYYYMIECYQDGKCIYTQNDFTWPLAGIEEVHTEAAAADGAAYDLQGRRLAKPAPGQLYIRDGRLHRN